MRVFTMGVQDRRSRARRGIRLRNYFRTSAEKHSKRTYGISSTP